MDNELNKKRFISEDSGFEDMVSGRLEKGADCYRHLLKPIACYGYSVVVEHGRPSLSSYGPGCAEVTGYLPEEFAADPLLWYRIIHIEDREAVIEQADAVLSGTFVAPLNYRIFHKDGQVRWVRNALVPRYDVHGCLVSYEGLISIAPVENRKEHALLSVRRCIEKATRN